MRQKKKKEEERKIRQGVDGGQGVDRKPMDILAKWFLNEHRRDQFFTLVNDGEVTWFKQEVTRS